MFFLTSLVIVVYCISKTNERKKTEGKRKDTDAIDEIEKSK